MEPPEDLPARARSVIDANSFMTLATADEDGQPWASPVWYALDGYRRFIWVSSPDARHSRNIAVRPAVAAVIFDSHRARGWSAVYLSAVVEQIPDEQVDEAIELFTRRSVEKGLRPWTRDEVLAPARHRLYAATATEQFVLDHHDRRVPVDLG